MDFRDELEMNIFMFGESDTLENITIGLVKQDNIECCVCLTDMWGVKLPNCNHFVCPKCYYKIYTGYIGEQFYTKNSKPKYPEKPIYPYQNQDANKELFNTITKDNAYLEWFVDNNQDLYNSIKMNTTFVEDLDVCLKFWFENNQLITQYENDLIQYEKDLDNYYVDIEKYNKKYEEEKNDNSQRRCPLCRL